MPDKSSTQWSLPETVRSLALHGESSVATWVRSRASMTILLLIGSDDRCETIESC